MTIICEYCGGKIDTDKSDVCPNCGAPFDNQKVLDAQKAEQREKQAKLAAEAEERREAARKERERMINRQEQLMKQAEKQKHPKRSPGCIVAVIIFLIIIIITAFSQIIEEYEYYSGYDEDSSSAVASEPAETDVPVSGDFDEYVQTVNYSVICDSFEQIDGYPFKPHDGYVYMAFHLKVKNTGTGKISPTNDIICLADGNMCEDFGWSELKEISTAELPAGVSTEGTACFEVPADAKMFEIRYGDYVTIHIKNAPDSETEESSDVQQSEQTEQYEYSEQTEQSE